MYTSIPALVSIPPTPPNPTVGIFFKSRILTCQVKAAWPWSNILT